MGIGIVQTKSGKVRGVELTGRYAALTLFKGIPFAAPPVGKRRWRPPEAPQPWEGVRICDTYAEVAPQMMPPIEKFVPYGADFYYQGYPKQSEDCLYLNVCTGAQNENERRPVYIWFHGGGLSTGFSYEIEFDPSEMARKGIVVVQAAQRLNVFGYLALPQLSKEQGTVSGNYGLMDQLAVLDWVRGNISSFGGDPDNITVGGQSGGATKTGIMAGLPVTQGKIRRVINQSGLKWKAKLKTPQEMYERCRQYLKKLGVNPDLPIDELRRLPASLLCDGSKDMPEEMICDGILVPETSVEILYEKYLGKVDFLCGTNFGEGFPQVAGAAPVTDVSSFYANYRALLGDLFDEYSFDEIYPVTVQNFRRTAHRLACIGLSANDRRGMSRNVMLNRIFGMQRAQKVPGSKTFVYFFGHVLPSRPEDEGTERDSKTLLAYHSSELWYTFASLRENVPPVRPWREADYRMADMVNSYWVNFIATGDVNGDGLPHWPAVQEDYGWMELLPQPVARQGLTSMEDQLLRAYVKRAFGE